MAWVKLNSERLLSARYKDETGRLDIKMADGRVVTHRNILPHMFETLANDQAEADFYYNNYIRPNEERARYGVAVRMGHLTKAAVLVALFWMLSAIPRPFATDVTTADTGPHLRSAILSADGPKS